MGTRIIVNGREYASVGDMPSDVRQAYEQALARFPEASGDGIRDLAERGAVRHMIGMHRTSITFNGRTFESSGPMPGFLRQLFTALGAGADAARSGAHDPHGQEVGAPVQRAGLDEPSTTWTGVDGARHGPVATGRKRPLDALARLLAIILAMSALVVVAFAALIIATMHASSASQGGRVLVAIAAVALLGAISARATQLADRWWRPRGFLGTYPAARRFAALSLMGLVLAAAFLLGLALFLP